VQITEVRELVTYDVLDTIDHRVAALTLSPAWRCSFMQNNMLTRSTPSENPQTRPNDGGRVWVKSNASRDLDRLPSTPALSPARNPAAGCCSG
jgi:hypothetical protein